MQDQLHQVVVTHAKQRRLQSTGQRQVVCGRHQGIEQAHHVLHLWHIGQLVLFGLLGGYAQRSQLGLHQPQALTLAGQHHDVLGPERTGLKLLGQPAGGLAALQGFAGFFGYESRGGQGIAPASA